MNQFDINVDRSNTSSIKWNVDTNELPMWVADMDFETAPEIIEAIQNRAKHGVYGYTKLPNAWYTSIIKWYQRRYNLVIKPKDLLYSPGVIGSISTILRTYTNIGDKVLVMTPVYNTFFDTIDATKRVACEYQMEYNNSKYSFDIDQFTDAIKKNNPKVLILCNPHNPIGKAWQKEELEAIGQVCYENNVLVIADEIHGDLVLNKEIYTPFASINEVNRLNSVTCIAPTKTFNLAGLHTSSMIVYNKKLNEQIAAKLYADGVMLGNIFGIEASIASYKYGEKWLEELLIYLAKNKQIFSEYLAKNIPTLIPVAGDATYLEWVDCSQITDDSTHFASYIRETTGLYIAEGTKYRGNGDCFIRINLATSRDRIQDGLKRLELAVKNYNQR